MFLHLYMLELHLSYMFLTPFHILLLLLSMDLLL